MFLLLAVFFLLYFGMDGGVMASVLKFSSSGSGSSPGYFHFKKTDMVRRQYLK